MSPTVQFAVVAGVMLLGLIGWGVGGYIGAAVGLVLGLLVAAVPWHGQPLWSWAGHWLRRNRPIAFTEPITVVNDRSGGGVRYQDGVSVVAVQILGKPYTPTVLTGSASAHDRNAIDLTDLFAMMDQSLGLSIDSMSVVSAGARRRSTGDYPPVYDTMIGSPPYAGQRETWLIARITSFENADALDLRPTAGTAAIAVAQRMSAALRVRGIRARVATTTDIVELERRLGLPALSAGRRHWGSVRGEGGWLTTYGYRTADVRSEVLAQAWSIPADFVIQNITLFPDETVTASLTVRTAQSPPAPPAVVLQTLPGEQATALAANLCVPTRQLRGIQCGTAPSTLTIPVGPSGVLLGKVGSGDRLLLPLSDPGEFTRVHIAAEEHIAKRIVIRTAAAGDRITVHTRSIARWASVRMPDIAVTDQPRPAAGTTVSVVDGPLVPSPRPHTVISVGRPGESHRGHADIVITQIEPAMVEVSVAGRAVNVEVELFRAENRYVSSEPMTLMSQSRFADERR